MATEKPGPQAEAEFKDTLSAAVMGVVELFEWMGLPDEGSVQERELMDSLTAAIGSVMREWL